MRIPESQQRVGKKREEEIEKKRVADFISIWEQYDWTQYAEK